jgi:DNA-binding response OmpR family regulator
VVRLSILVIEDEPIIALDIQMILEEDGHHVLGPVGRLEQALHLLETSQPDLAILDLNLHGYPATPIAERLRARCIPFIVASADSSVVGGDAVFAGAEGITKPIQRDDLLAALYRIASLR